MWVRVVYLLEVFATLACIHSIYGKKIRWDVKPIALCLSLLVIYEVVNNLQNGGLYSLVAYIPIFIYCKRTFGTSVLQTLVKMLWLIILLTTIEFICIFIVASIIPLKWIRNIAASSLTVVIVVLVMPKIHINKMKYNSRKAIGYIGLMAGVMFLLILPIKLLRNVNMILFIFIIPASLILLLVLVKWAMAQEEVEEMRHEVELTNRMDEKYNELVDDIRIKQHGFKNHITAILSTHYTHKTYEKLVEAQDGYCNTLLSTNKYNNLLQLGNKVLIGFVYEKFREIEDDGVEVKYEISTSIEGCKISIYHLIEILGILLDNALEAVKGTERNIIIMKINETDNEYLFSIRNGSRHVTYEEIENWFHKGVSSKGNNRGLGLYHVKHLCQELGCNIYCKNVEYEHDNWIEMMLEVTKAD